MKPVRPRYSRIDSKVEQLLTLANVNGAPVPVHEIATKLGARVIKNNFKNEISGVLVRRENDVVIGVAEEQTPERQRFTIAHELGHLVLHEGEEVHIDKVNFRSSLSSTAEDVEEVEANAFAAALLMPRSFLFSDLEGQTVDIENEGQISQLARRYQVSTQAMTYRLINVFRIR